MLNRSQSVVQRTRGPVVPLNICFNEDGSVDFKAVRDYAGWLAGNGVPILMLTYGSSEFSSLTDDDLWRLTADIAEVNAGRSLFIAATGYWKPATCREFLKHADRVGADAVKVQIHPGMPLDRNVYLGYFDLIEGASDIPLMLLDALPPVSLAAELAARPNIVGAKIHDFGAYYDLIRATRNFEFAVISAGQMKNMIFGYQVGSLAYLCPIAPFLPAISLDFFAHLEHNRYDEAWEMVFKYEEPWLSGAVEVGWLNAIKSAIYLRGLYPNSRPCPPQLATTMAQMDKVRCVIEDVFGPIESVDL